jgi:hypothetical protein
MMGIQKYILSYFESHGEAALEKVNVSPWHQGQNPQLSQSSLARQSAIHTQFCIIKEFAILWYYNFILFLILGFLHLSKSLL